MPQTFNNCGLANLSIVLDYHGDETTRPMPPLIQAQSQRPQRQPVANQRLRQRVHGFKFNRSQRGEMEMLKRLIAAGYAPVIERGADFDDGQGGTAIT